MKKVILKKNKIDNILKIPRPTVVSPNWSTMFDTPQEYFDEFELPYFYNEKNEVIAQKHYPKWSISHNSMICNQQLFDIEETPTNNYFYIIGPSIPSDFYEKHKSFEDILDIDVINDIKNKKCKLVILHGDDGNYGEYVPFYSQDNTFENINNLCVKSNFEKESVIFISQNLIANDFVQKQNYNFICESFRIASETHVSNIQNLLDNHNNVSQNNIIEKLFLTYNKKTKNYRIYLLDKLIKNNLISNSIYSFYEPEDDTYNWQLESLNNLLSYKLKKTISLNNFLEILNQYSKKIEDKDMESFNGDYHGQFVQIDDYKKTFLSLVSESNVGNNTIYFSEKTFKPILAKHPFILLSSPNSLKKLKELGYKTFDKWWDESYDEAIDYVDRIDKIINVLNELSKKSLDYLEKMKEEIQEVVDFNLQHYLKTKESNDFLYKILKKHM